MPLTPDDEALLAELPPTSRATARIRQLLTERDAAYAERDTLTASTATHAEALAAAKLAGHAEATASLTPQIELSRSGITDPEGIEVALYLYGRQPSEGRPPIAEWASTSKALASYRPAPPPVAVAPPSTVATPAIPAPVVAAVAPPIPAPNPNGPPAPAGGGLSAASILGTRDWAADKGSVFAALDARLK